MTAYSVGEDVELGFTIGSSQSTAPESATVDLVVMDPLGAVTQYGTTDLTTLAPPSSDSTSEGWARWQKLVPVAVPGRWTYQFRSTGTVHTSMGGAFAVRGALALASTGD